jgi:methyl-accepting chemotaxis protein
LFKFIERAVFRLERIADKEDRYRGRMLGYILLGLIALSILLVLIIPRPGERLAVSLITLSSLLCLALLHFSRLDPSVILMTSSVAILSYATLFTVPFQHNMEIYQLGIFGLFSLVLASLVARKSLPFYILGALGLIAIVLQLFLRRLPDPEPLTASNISGYAVVLIIFGMSGVILRGVAARNRELLVRSAAQALHEHHRAEQYAGIVVEARKSLDAGSGLTASAERTNKLVKEMLDNGELMRQNVDALHDEGRRVEAASVAMAKASDSTSRSVSEQVAVIEETSAAVVEMTASIESISRIASERQEAINELAREAEQGSAAIARVTEAMAGLKGRVADTGEVVKVIKKVATQTGLLAMNASIEAAHAGDAGGGFAVVAAEIRKLADETAKNAKIIAETLGAVTASIGQAASTNEEAAIAYERVRVEVKNVAGAISEIAQGVSELSSGTDEINKGTTQSVQATQAVKEAVISVNDRVSEVEHGLRSQERAASAIAGSIKDMTERLQGLADEAAKVQEAGLMNQHTLAGLGRKLEGIGSGAGPGETGVTIKTAPARV